MKLFHINGRREVNIVSSKYAINWGGKCRSKVQFRAKQFFKDFWSSDFCTEELKIPGSLMTCDLINHSKSIACETDGLFHEKFSEFHHKTKFGFLASLKRDEAKDQWYERNGIFVIRVTEKEVDSMTYEWILKKFNIDILDNYS